MDFSEAQRLRDLEDDNARLKRLLAAAMPDSELLNDLLSKCIVHPTIARVSWMTPSMSKCIRPLDSQTLLAKRPC